MANIIDYAESRLSYYRAYTGSEYARNTERSKIANEMYNRIRAEALKDAADRAWREVDTWIHIEGDDNGYAKVHMEGLLKTAIYAGEVKE